MTHGMLLNCAEHPESPTRSYHCGDDVLVICEECGCECIRLRLMNGTRRARAAGFVTALILLTFAYLFGTALGNWMGWR